MSLGLFIHALSEAFNASASFQPDLLDEFLSANCPVSPGPQLSLAFHLPFPNTRDSPSCQSKLKCCQLSWPGDVLRLSRFASLRPVPFRPSHPSSAGPSSRSNQCVPLLFIFQLLSHHRNLLWILPPFVRLNEACSLYLHSNLNSNLKLKSNLSNALASVSLPASQLRATSMQMSFDLTSMSGCCRRPGHLLKMQVLIFGQQKP